MEPKFALPCSPEPTIGFYPDPDQSNPYHPVLRVSMIQVYLPVLICFIAKSRTKYVSVTAFCIFFEYAPLIYSFILTYINI